MFFAVPVLVVSEAKEGEVEGLKREADKEDDLGDRKKRKREEEKDSNSSDSVKSIVSKIFLYKRINKTCEN